MMKHPKHRKTTLSPAPLFSAAALAAVTTSLSTPVSAAPAFDRLHLEERYFSEGANFGDLNKDGTPDAVSGPHWWEGPTFEKRHTFYETKSVNPDVNGYTGDNFFSFVYDCDGDGWNDVVVVPIPGTTAHWYQNPGSAAGDEGGKMWAKHAIVDDVGNESPWFTDAVGEDGKPELWCLSGGRYGYATPKPGDATSEWVFHPVTGDTGQHKYTHGMGLGDLDGDGRKDLLLKDGWLRQPSGASGDGGGMEWAFHKFSFRPVRLKPMPGGAQILVNDVDGDGDNDFITSIWAHGFGLAWFEQAKADDGGTVWVEHEILPENPAEKPDALSFSQLHAIEQVDIDGDGLLDIVTGKCRYAHGPGGDPEPKADPVVYWFQLVRGEGGKTTFTPHLIDDKSGVGRQVSSADPNGDGKPDLIIGNKLGTFVFLSK